MAIAYHWESLPLKDIDSGPIKIVKVYKLTNGDMMSDNLHADMNCEVDGSWVGSHFGSHCVFQD